MARQQHIVVFSHGFGVRKDSRGLFTDIANALPGVEPVMFDYDEVDEVKNTITLRPLPLRAKRLLQEIGAVQSDDVTIDVIGHSQGCVVAGLAKPKGIRKLILLTPPYRVSPDSLKRRFEERPGSVIDTGGISKLVRRDGGLMLVPPEYWSSLERVDPVALYNELASETKLIAVEADQDEVITYKNLSGLSNEIQVIHINGDHNFTGESRAGLLETLQSILLN